MQKIILHITDFHCPSCVMRLEGIEDDVVGIASVKASYARQTIEVTFDETVVDQEGILTAIENIGYHPAR